jgi:hypothetical protein
LYVVYRSFFSSIDAVNPSLAAMANSCSLLGNKKNTIAAPTTIAMIPAV